ncbi:MAG: hypothetical protein AAFR51_05690 [Pseudomonadota bacterium]
MIRTILATTTLALLAGAPMALAQQNPLIPNTGGMPAACPSMDDMTRTLKLADEFDVIVRLREDAKVTRDQKCEGYIKIIEDGLQKSLLAVVSQQTSNVCRAYAQPEVKSALAATFLVSFPYNSAPCTAFK